MLPIPIWGNGGPEAESNLLKVTKLDSQSRDRNPCPCLLGRHIPSPLTLHPLTSSESRGSCLFSFLPTSIWIIQSPRPRLCPDVASQTPGSRRNLKARVMRGGHKSNSPQKGCPLGPGLSNPCLRDLQILLCSFLAQPRNKKRPDPCGIVLHPQEKRRSSFPNKKLSILPAFE